MRELLDSDDMDFRFSIGLSRPSYSLQLTDRDSMVQSMATHYSVLSVKAELDQLIDGLKVLGVLDLLRNYPKVMRPLLLCKKPVCLTSDYVIDMFKPVMSLPGSNQREKEEALTLHWVNYVQLIEGKVLKMYKTPNTTYNQNLVLFRRKWMCRRNISRWA